ncbi:MAG TPA: transposase [Bacteroidota bacterium]|nr:transposase [Bacteroidota bacterium]
MIIEKKHRLSEAAYAGRILCSFVICVDQRKHFFISEKTFTPVEEFLLSELEFYSCGAEVYLFMPDHGHLILRGLTDSANVLTCLKSFKQKTGFWFHEEHASFRWQKNLYDHVLRADEEIVNQIKYVLNNPVRKGIVANWKDYAFKGSTVHDLSKWPEELL